MLSNFSIRFKLLIVIVILLVPLVTLRAINIYKSYNNNIDNELKSYEYLAQAISTSFTNYVEEIWATEYIVGTYIEEHKDLSPDEISRYLRMVTQKQGGILRMSWIDPKGIIVASSDERYMQKLLPRRKYFTQIQGGKEKVLSDLVTSIMEPYPCVIPVARASYDENGNLFGVVMAVIDTSKLDQRLPFFGSNSDIQYLLIDSSGKLVYSNADKKTPNSMISLADGYAVQKALKGYIVTGIKVKSEIDDSERLSIDYPVPGIGWVCRAFSPFHLAMASYQRQLCYDIAILTGVTLISVTMALILSSFLFRKISSLTIAARKIMEGDYSARTNIKGSSEIGMASQAFDKMAESIERWNYVNTQFFTNISHELKTPVNVIFSSVQLIESFKNSLDYPTYQKKISNQMKIIRQNCYRIIRIISNLIDISRNESGFLKVQFGNFDIVKLVRNITLSVRPYVESKEIRLCYAAELDSKIMACNPDMIERILLNLISNAIKFTDKGGTISVSLHDSHDNIIIRVKDTGIGIPEERLSEIFDRFKQADDPLMRNKWGSGLGLSLVKAFVEAHGGTISVASEVNKGTVFDITLPYRLTAGLPEEDLSEKKENKRSQEVDRINIEFSDIYSVYYDG